MKPIAEFPYEGKQGLEHLMHERMLLLKMQSIVDDVYTAGYYDAVHDVFKVCSAQYQDTKEHKYEKQSIAGNYSQQHNRYFLNSNPYSNVRCPMPSSFIRAVGPRRITHFATMENVIQKIDSKGLLETDIDKVCEEAGFCESYLLYMNYHYIIISNMGNFAQRGKQFKAASPVTVNGYIRHFYGLIPRDMIYGAISIRKLEEQMTA